MKVENLQKDKLITKKRGRGICTYHKVNNDLRTKLLEMVTII
jgi:hypothetical protein